MGLLIAGVLLWSGAHLFKRVLPESRAKLGSAGRGVVAILLVFSLVLMFLGYRQASGPVLWVTDPSLNMITNGLSLFAVYLMAASMGPHGLLKNYLTPNSLRSRPGRLATCWLTAP